MRITQTSIMTGYSYNMSNLRSNYDRYQQQITSQKMFSSPSEAPAESAEVKRLTNSIDQNTVYQKNIEDGLTDVGVYESTLRIFEERLVSVKDVAMEAAKPTNFDKSPTMANQLRGMLNDLIETANYEFDGRFAFAGTKTTRASITPTPPATSNLPFELVNDPSLVSSTNPSGLSVVFQGNNNDRMISTSTNTNERISARASSAFGGTGTQVFQQIIDAYNILAYKSDGTARTDQDHLTTAESNAYNANLKKIGDSIDTVNSEVGRLGGVINRMEAVHEQINFENTRLRDLRSIREDTDIPEAIMKLQREDNAIQATLKVGADIIQRSLLDFLR